LLSVGLAGAFSLLNARWQVSAEEAARWGSAAHGLAIGLGVQSDLPHGHLLVFLKNVGPTALDLFVFFSELKRIDFTATAPDGREYALTDRELYRPCAGLCGLPLGERLNPQATRKWTFALEDLLYVPPKGPYTNAGILLQRGYSIRASFEMTAQQLKDSSLSLEHPWRGRVVSGETRSLDFSRGERH